MIVRTAFLAFSLTVAALAQTPSPSPASKPTAPKSTTSKKTTAAAPNPTAIIHTTAGDMKCELFPDQAPKAVANFIGLAKGTKPWKNPEGKMVHGKPLYDGVIFHRVIPNFVIQAGDPSGGQDSDVGFEFADELHADLLYDKPGRLGMANRGPNTNSSQFFITEVPIPFLNPCFDPGGCMQGARKPNTGYTIFGQCDDATVELAKKITGMPCKAGPCTPSNSSPQNPVKITHVEIVSAAGGGTKPSARKSSAAKTASPKPSPSASPGK